MRARSALGLAVLVLMLVSGLLWSAPPATAEEPTYYRLVKVDCIADHADNDFVKEWLSWHTVTRESDGSITSRGFGTDHYMAGWWGQQSSWRIWIAKGKANWNQTDPDGALEITWTTPPAIWSSDQDFKFDATVLASGAPWGGLRLRDFPVERFNVSSVEVEDPWNGITAGTWSGGFKPSASGSTR